MSIIDIYIQGHLTPELRSLGLTYGQAFVVGNDIKVRLESLLAHWHDETFRKTISLIGHEEALFWEPSDVSLDVRALVVTGIRNSVLTDLNAKLAYTKTLRSKKIVLPDNQMPWITGNAIRYFARHNLSEQKFPVPESDLFGSLQKKFPKAWDALSRLANSSDQEVDYTALPATGEQCSPNFNLQTTHQEIESGIAPHCCPALSAILASIQKKELELFFSPCLKTITRNPEKLLGIIDHILNCDATILTVNYVISPTYLARRIPPLRAFRTSHPDHNAQVKEQLSNLNGLVPRHRNLLISYLTQMPSL